MAALVVSGWSSLGRCDEPVQAIRRVLVPAENPESWPRDGKAFLPVEASDFEGWLKAANEPASSASIVDAEYHARFVAGKLVDTHGHWQVTLAGNHAARLPLEDVSLLIRAAKWRDRQAAAVRLGWWPSSQNGEVLVRALEVPQSGVLDFEWSTAAQTADESWSLPLDLPPAARTRLILELPAGKRPDVDGSAVVESPTPPEEGGRWILALSTAGPQVLRIENADGSESALRSTTVRQFTRYAIRRGGLDAEATIELSAAGSLPQSIVVVVPAWLSMVSAECGDETMPWRVIAQPAGRMRRVSIKLPATNARRTASVILKAWGPLVVDERQRLPLLAPEGVFWAAGEIELSIDDAIELRDVSTTDCIQTEIEIVDSAKSPARQLRFAAYGLTAALEIEVRHRRSLGIAETGASLELGGSAARGQVVSQIRVERGQLHQLAGKLRPGWVIDAVETVPADLLREWYVDLNSEPHRLCLQLDSATTPGKPLRVVTTAHSSATGIESVAVADLNPLAWQRLKSETTLLELQPAEQYDLEVQGVWNELSRDMLAAEQRELLSGAEGARLSKIEEGAEATIRLIPKRIAYDATVQIAAVLLGDRCELSYEVVCTPAGGGIDHVLLFFAEPSAAPIQWIDAESERPLKAEKMPGSDPRFGGLPTGGELRRLEFGRLYARPIKIAAKQSIPWRDRHRIPLVSLPDAAAQQGRITIANVGSEPPSIVAQNMAPAPLPLQTDVATPVNEPAVVRAVYRFQPTRLYDSAAVPQLSLRPAGTSGGERLIVAGLDVESRFAVDGSGVHRAVYRINNQGAATFDLSFPRGVILANARVDGAPAATEPGRRLALALPPRKQQVIAELEFSSRGPALANGGRLSSPLPLSEVALLAGEWTVKLPHGFLAIGPQAAESGSACDWRERLFGPLARRAGKPFNPLDASDWNGLWITASSLLGSTAQAASDSSPATGDSTIPDGTEAYRFTFGTTPPPFVVVAHRPATTAAALTAFVLCAVGVQLARCKTRTRLWLALVTAATSLLVPAVWAPLATGATLGFVAAAAWQWMQPSSCAVLVVILATGAAMPNASQAAPEDPAIESVLVPVNKDGNSVGTKYFLSADFLRQLLSQSKADANSGDWLLADVRCEGQLVSSNGQEGVTTGAWRLSVEIDALRRDITVTLPLVRAEADWPATASIDGIPAAISWNESGHGCSTRIAEPGRHRVTISFEPHWKPLGSRRELELRLPPIAGAAVSVSGPREIGELSSAGAPLVRRDESQQSVWQGELGPSGRLTLSWPIGLESEVGETDRQVAQVSLLSISPPGIFLDLQLVQRGTDPRWPESIQLAVESSWRLAPGTKWVAESVESLPDGRQVLVIPVPATVRSEPRLTLRFVSSQSSPLGQLRPPAIEVVSLPLAGRWLGIECDSRLECEPSDPTGESARAFSKLALELSSDDDQPPTIVVDLNQIAADWHLAVRPAPVSSSFRDRLSIAAGQDRFRVNYRSDVIPQGADRFGGSFAVPDELSIESVTATEDSEPISLEWVRVDRGHVNVFFDRKVSGAYRLEVTGRLPVPSDGLLTLPRIAPLNRLDASQVVAFYRDDNLSAEWRFPAERPWVESGASLTNPFDGETHFVQAFPVDAATASGVQLAVERSEPALAGETLTRLVRGKNGWEVIWECSLHVEHGTLDVLRLQLPGTCAGPFDVTPTGKLQVAAPRGADGDFALALRLSQPVQAEETIQLMVRSPLAAPDGQPVAAPRIRVLAEGERTEFLSLPTGSDGENLTWTRSGIEPSNLPPTLPESAAPSEAIAIFRIASDEMNVTLRPRPPHADLASVRLAETVSFTGNGGEKLHLTRFFISPGGLDHCDVQLPPRQSLIRADVGGQLATMHGQEPRHLRVQLGHPVLPQILDIATRCKPTDDSSDRIELAQPVLEQGGRAIPVDVSLWTLHGDFAGRRPHASGGTLVSAAALASLRLDWLISISQASTRAALEVPAVDGYSWFVRWTASLRTASRLAERASQNSSDASPPIRVKPAATDSTDAAASQSSAWIEQMAELFRATEMQLADDEQNFEAALLSGRVEIGGREDVQCFVSDGSRGPLVVAFTAENFTPTQTRYFALGSLALVAVVAAWLARTPRVLELVLSWPEAWSALIGLAAWAWLRPSSLGLAIAGVSLGLLVRRIQREKKSPRHDSSKLPTSIPEELA